MIIEQDLHVSYVFDKDTLKPEASIYYMIENNPGKIIVCGTSYFRKQMLSFAINGVALSKILSKNVKNVTVKGFDKLTKIYTNGNRHIYNNTDIAYSIDIDLKNKCNNIALVEIEDLFCSPAAFYGTKFECQATISYEVEEEPTDEKEENTL